MSSANSLDLDLDIDEDLGLAHVKAASGPNQSTLQAQKTTTLSPRFYTTDYREMDRMSVDALRPEWQALLDEFAADKNRGHFKRNAEWDFDPASLPEPLKREVIDFMVSSLTSEFSGCVLYAELRKRCSNPDLVALFKYMSRDEARHAGFINDCLRDFDMQVDMGFLAKAKKYTFFSPKFILYATYLSEKIGYARYIKIYRHLEQHPEHRFHPIFKWFKEWCNDEFRHGEALALMMRANPQLLKGTNRLWIRFFQVAVFATMFVRDHSRVAFHEGLGVEPEAYGMDVFRITSEIAKQVFPDLVDVEHPGFLAGLRKLNDLAVRIDKTRKTPSFFGRFKVAGLQLLAVATFVRLLLLPVKANTLPADPRVAPAW